MRVNDMAKIQNYDVSELVGGQSKADIERNQYNERNTTVNIPFVQPNWNHIMTKSEPLMSDSEFERAIWEMAQNDAANGLGRMDNKEVAKLRSAFVSVVSPDRKAAYNQSMAKTGGLLNTSHSIFGNDGSRLMHYNQSMGAWLPRTTGSELSRMADFNRIYNEAYTAYEKENGKVMPTPTSPAQVVRAKFPH